MAFPIVRLDDHVLHVSSGATPKGGSSNYMKSGPVMFLRSQNIHMNELRLDDVIYISDEIHQKMSRSQVQFGDVLINITGASIGRVSSFEIKDTKVNTNQHVCTIRPNPETLNYKYLSYILGSQSFQHGIFSSQRGGTREALNYSQIRDFKIPLPPLPEQKRIAAILDKADQLRQKRQQAIGLADEFLRSVFLDMFGDMFSTRGYAETSKASISELTTYIDYRGKTPEKSDSGIPLITAKNVKKGYVSEEPREFIPENNYEEWMTRGKPLEGDVLFTTEAPLGNVALLGKYNKVVVGQRLVSLRVKERLTPEYLMFCLLNPFIQGLIEGRSSGSTAKGIRTKELYAIKLPVPALDLQKQFSERYWKLRRTLELQQNSVYAADTLFNSLSQKAFAGEL